MITVSAYVHMLQGTDYWEQVEERGQSLDCVIGLAFST